MLLYWFYRSFVSLLGLHLKGLSVLDWIVLPILNVWSPVATERFWCRLMTRLCGVASTNWRITSEWIRDFIFSMLYKQKSCFGIQSYLLLSFACAVQYSRWTRQYWSTVIGSQNIFFRALFWPLAVTGVRMCLRLLWHSVIRLACHCFFVSPRLSSIWPKMLQPFSNQSKKPKAFNVIRSRKKPINISVTSVSELHLYTPWTLMGKSRYSSTHINLVSRWRRVVNFLPQPLCPLGIPPGTDWVGGWVDLRTRLDILEKRKKSLPRRESNHNFPVQPVTLSLPTEPSKCACVNSLNCLRMSSDGRPCC